MLFPIALLVLSQVVLSDFLDYTQNFEKSCFPVHVPQGGSVPLDVNILAQPFFTGEKAMMGLIEDKPMPDGESVTVLIYREKEIDAEMTFTGDHGILKICNEEAISKKYCEARDAGNLLFKYKNPKAKNFDVYSNVFREIKTYEAVTNVSETGSYCVQAAFNTTTTRAIYVTPQDSQALSEESNHRDLLLYIFGSVALLVPTLIFAFIWLIWSSFKWQKIPFLVKAITINLLLENFGRLEVLSFEIFEFSYLSYEVFYTIHLFVRFFRVFLVFQYSNNFTFERIPFGYYWLFSVFGALYLLQLINQVCMSMDVSPEWLNLIDYTYILFDFCEEYAFPVLIFIRYLMTAKKYYDNNNSDDVLFKSFRMWILCSLYTLLSNTFGFEVLLRIDDALGKSQFIKDKFAIDGIVPNHFFLSQIFALALELFMVFFPLFFKLTPKTYVNSKLDKDS